MHASMKQVAKGTTATCFVGDTLQFRGRNVPYQDLGMAQWLLAHGLKNVSNCQVNRICRLVAEMGQLCLIRGDNQGDDCSPWSLCLEAFLMSY